MPLPGYGFAKPLFLAICQPGEALASILQNGHQNAGRLAEAVSIILAKDARG